MVVFSLFFGKLAKMPSDGVPYPLFSVRRARALDVFCERPDAVGQQPRRQRQPAEEGLLSAAAIPIATVLSGIVDFALAFVRAAADDDGLLRHRADGRRRLAAALPSAGARHGARRRAVAVGAERAVPRRPLRGAVPHAVLDVRHADRLSEQPADGAVAHRAMASTRWSASSRGSAGRLLGTQTGARGR